MASDGDRDSQEALRLQNVVDRERAKLRALQDISSALGSTLDLGELLEMILDRISEVMEADRSTLYLLDEETDELWSKVIQGEEVHEIRLKPGEGLAGAVASTGKPLNIKDAYQDVRFDAAWDRATGYRTRSTLCVPMKNQHGRTIGVVQVLNKHEGHFTIADEALLAALASHAAVSIENSKLFLSVVGKNIELLETKEKLEKKIRELDVLFEITQVAASAMELDDLLAGVLARTMRATDAEAASILLADQYTGDLTFRAAVGGEPDRVKKMKIKSGQGISGWVAENGRPQIVNRVDEDSRHSTHISDEVGYHPKSLLCVPLRWDEGAGGLAAPQQVRRARPVHRRRPQDGDGHCGSFVNGHRPGAVPGTDGAPRAPDDPRALPLEHAPRSQDPADRHLEGTPSSSSKRETRRSAKRRPLRFVDRSSSSRP